jgi:4-diphosphocytidyl-2-C-methyl-D-erythritol kinase
LIDMIILRASAKLNLYLSVLGKRRDGYHEVDTLYQPVSLYDDLVLKREKNGITIAGDDPSIPWNESNICVKAAEKMIERTGIRGGVDIKISKGIPAGSGLGGGSSDAAATIIGLNELYGLSLSKKELMEVASEIGSDVPFFVFGGSAVGKGKGDLLEPAEGLPGGWILIVKPDVSISTEWAYRNLNKGLTRFDYEDTLNALKVGLVKFPEVNLKAFNSFEKIVVDSFPEVREVLEELRNEDSILCAMSGSGSACFAVFSEERIAEEALSRQIGRRTFAKIARPVERTIELLQED